MGDLSKKATESLADAQPLLAEYEHLRTPALEVSRMLYEEASKVLKEWPAKVTTEQETPHLHETEASTPKEKAVPPMTKAVGETHEQALKTISFTLKNLDSPDLSKKLRFWEDQIRQAFS